MGKTLGFTTPDEPGQFGAFWTREELETDLHYWLDRLRYSGGKWARYPQPVSKTQVVDKLRYDRFDFLSPGEFMVRSAAFDKLPYAPSDTRLELPVESRHRYQWLFVKYAGPDPATAEWLPPKPEEVDPIFQDPPDLPKRELSQIRVLLEQAKHYPGQWLRSKRPVRQMSATPIVEGTAYSQRKGVFDAVVRQVVPDEHRKFEDAAKMPFLYVMFLDPGQFEDERIFNPIPDDEQVFKIVPSAPTLHKRKTMVDRILKQQVEGMHGDGAAAPRSALSLWLDRTVRHMPPGRWAYYPFPHSDKAPKQLREGTGYGAVAGEFEVDTYPWTDELGYTMQVLRVRRFTGATSKPALPADERPHVKTGLIDPPAAALAGDVGKGIPPFDSSWAEWSTDPGFSPTGSTIDKSKIMIETVKPLELHLKAKGFWRPRISQNQAAWLATRSYFAQQGAMLASTFGGTDPETGESFEFIEIWDLFGERFDWLDWALRKHMAPEVAGVEDFRAKHGTDDYRAANAAAFRATDLLDRLRILVLVYGIKVLPEDFGPACRDGKPAGPDLDRWTDEMISHPTAPDDVLEWVDKLLDQDQAWDYGL